MKKQVITLILVLLLITGCNKGNYDEQKKLNFSDEKSNKNFAEIYEFEDGSKIYSEFANIRFVVDNDEKISLKKALDSWVIQNRVYDEMLFDRSVLYSSNKIYGTGMEVKSFGKDKPLTIVGHTPLKEVTYCDDINVLCIDTAGFLESGRISVIDMDTFMCYDSNGEKKKIEI